MAVYAQNDLDGISRKNYLRSTGRSAGVRPSDPALEAKMARIVMRRANKNRLVWIDAILDSLETEMQRGVDARAKLFLDTSSSSRETWALGELRELRGVLAELEVI
jgi:hypothetical protein